MSLLHRMALAGIIVALVLLNSCGKDSTNPDTTPPSLISVYPGVDARDIPIGASITVSFSEPMSIASFTGLSFSITPGVAGSFVKSGAKISFEPDSSLKYVTTYTVAMTNDVTDEAGNKLDTSLTWSFTTSANPNTGITWAKYAMSGNTVPMNGLATNQTRVVAVGDSGRIFYSSSYPITSATTWTRFAVSDTIDNLNEVTWSGTHFVAVGDRGVAYVSRTGTTDWSASATQTGHKLNAVTYFDGQFVAVGDSMTLVKSTNDAASWQVVPNGATANDTLPDLLDVVAASNPKNLVIVGSILTGGGIMKTKVYRGSFVSFSALIDATISGDNRVLNSIAHSNYPAQYVAVGNDASANSGVAKWATDGSTWVTTLFPSSQVNDLAWTQGLFVAACNSGQIWTSPPATSNTSWTDRSSHYTSIADFRAVLWGGEQIVVVGTDGEVLVSPDNSSQIP